MRLWCAAILVLVAEMGYGSFRPVCVPLSSEDLARFNTPIAQRTDRDFYLTVFPQRDGQWHQCKTWRSRQFFF
jgi:hypothetical protein